MNFVSVLEGELPTIKLTDWQISETEFDKGFHLFETIDVDSTALISQTLEIKNLKIETNS